MRVQLPVKHAEGLGKCCSDTKPFYNMVEEDVTGDVKPSRSGIPALQQNPHPCGGKF